jgi:NAD(P)H dehydrogenase (quinone)
MKVLTVYAHPEPRSFCHSVLERFTAGLADAGHTSQVVDLYATKFDPVFRHGDVASYIDANVPPSILDRMDPRQRVMDDCRGPLQRWLAARALRGKSQAEIAGLIRDHMPKDARAQQEKVLWADGLAFIAPIHFTSFPAILRGWIERVFTYGFAYGLTEAAWNGDVNGRLPLLRHQRALIMTSTLFDEAAYDDGIRDAIGRALDDWCFRYPGIPDVEHVYFYTATTATPETIARYLEQAYDLGLHFDRSTAGHQVPAARAST